LPEDISKKLSTLNADLTKFEIILNGDVTNPNLQLSSEISDLTLQGFQLGRFNTEADLNNFELSLSSKVIGNNNKEYLMADLQSLILNSQNFTIDSTSKIIANIKMSDLPLPLASPFIPMIKDMTGNASSDINISGYALDPRNQRHS
jgi:autotransporter translocation and assembly factor TamB